MHYLKLYEDYTESLFEQLPAYEHRNIDRNTYIKLSDYTYKKDLTKYIISVLPSIFGHNEFLTRNYESIDYGYDVFDILERKHLPFSISLTVNDEDYFIVKLTYYCLEAVYLYWKCDGIKGFIALLKHLIQQRPEKNKEFVGKNMLDSYKNVKFDTDYNFTYTEEQLKELIKKINISDVFSVKLVKLDDLSWSLNIGDMLYFDINYIPYINCFRVGLSKRNFEGKILRSFGVTCFTEEGLYYFLDGEYQNLEGMYVV